MSIKYEDIENKVKGWLTLTDLSVLKVILATVVTNYYPGDPLWLFIIAPPSTLKTELLRGLRKSPRIYTISSLTPQTLVSGFKDKRDMSLLPKLNNQILILKDFTTVLTINRDSRQEILAQLREIYDGQYKKAFGTGKVVDWNGKVGVIAGVTPIIDTHYAMYQVLGERFIQYRVTAEDPIASASRAIDNNGEEDGMREDIATLIATYLGQFEDSKAWENITTPEETKHKILNLSAFCVVARSSVERDSRSREIAFVAEPEAPPRFAKQLAALGHGLAIINGADVVGPDEYRLIHRVGMDSLPKARRRLIDGLIEVNDWIDTSSMAERLQYPIGSTRRILEDLASLGVLAKKRAAQDYWMLSEISRGYLSIAVPEKS